MRSRCSLARAAVILGIGNFRKHGVIETVALHAAARIPHDFLLIFVGIEIADELQPPLAQEGGKFAGQQAEAPGLTRSVDLCDGLVRALECDGAVEHALMDIGEDELAAFCKPARPAHHATYGVPGEIL